METATTYQQNNTAIGTTRGSSNTLLKTSAKYMVEALGEGIKQSLNGMDINVEFITLTARSFAQTSGDSVKKIISKYSAARKQFAEKRFHYTNTTTLSHS